MILRDNFDAILPNIQTLIFGEMQRAIGDVNQGLECKKNTVSYALPM
jgi:hypothetical protein